MLLLFHVLGFLVIFLCLLNALILVHELGHLFAAGLVGVPCGRLVVWFGPLLWQGSIGRQRFGLGCLPFGGYLEVASLALGPNVRVSARPNPWQRFVVAAAGPLASLFFAVLLGSFLWVVGVPTPPGALSTKLAYVAPDSAAYHAGLRPGDTVLAVDGTPVTKFSGLGNSFEALVSARTTPTVRLTLARHGRILVLVVPCKFRDLSPGRPPLRVLPVLPTAPAIIGAVFPHSPLSRTRVRAGDQVLFIDSHPVLNPALVSTFVHTGRTARLLVKPPYGSPFYVSVVPQVPQQGGRPLIGISWDRFAGYKLVHPQPLTEVYASVSTVMGTLESLCRPSGIAVSNLSGPLGIIHVTYVLFNSPAGWRLLVFFFLFLNVNLALFNLLPLPLLDGGHILIAALQLIFPALPRSIAVLKLQAAVASLLVATLLYLSFYDCLGWTASLRPQPASPIFSVSK